MEDSVGEEERREQDQETMAMAMAQGKKRGREEEQVEAGGGRVVQGKEEVVAVAEEAGFLSSMASKIGAAMSGTDRSGGTEDGGESNGSRNVVPTGAGGQDEKEDGNGAGGIFHRLLSSSSPSPPVTAGTEEVKRGGKDEDEGGGEQSGILSAMASKIGMAMSGANGNGTRVGSEEHYAKASNGDADHSKGESKEEGHESNSNGIVRQLMSNLPTSDTRGPNAEEASMLIAIIED